MKVVALLEKSGSLKEDKIIFAMVGDSITWGYASTDPATKSYPTQFAKLLGDDARFEVRNFGVSGSTMSKQGDLSYWT